MTTTKHQIECANLPILSSRNHDWEHILIEQFQHPAGEGRTFYSDEHSLCMSLAQRPVGMLQTQGDRTQTGTFAKGDFCITPAKIPFFARWDSDDCFLQIRLASRFIQSVGRESIDRDPDRLQLVPEFRTRDRQMEAIAMMLLAELQQGNIGGRLYIDSLTNVLAIHLLRQYAAVKPHLQTYKGGLPQRQLLQVLEYISEHLNQNIRLADLASLINMSQFHFSHMFKQTIGIAPHQYLLRQRIEQSKKLLRTTDQPIMDIALECGFNSHSHLSKQFRQLTDMTPRAYR